jgi:hypothetical protein
VWRQKRAEAHNSHAHMSRARRPPLLGIRGARSRSGAAAGGSSLSLPWPGLMAAWSKSPSLTITLVHFMDGERQSYQKVTSGTASSYARDLQVLEIRALSIKAKLKHHLRRRSELRLPIHPTGSRMIMSGSKEGNLT